METPPILGNNWKPMQHNIKLVTFCEISEIYLKSICNILCLTAEIQNLTINVSRMYWQYDMVT